MNEEMEISEKQKQKNLLLKLSLDYFSPAAFQNWFCCNVFFNFNEIPEEINYDRFKKYIENDLTDEKKNLLKSIYVNNIACVSKQFLTNLNDDTVNYIKEFIQFDLTLLYNIFKIHWLNGYYDLIKHEKKALEKKRSTLKFNKVEYEYVNRALKKIKRDERKIKKNAMFF